MITSIALGALIATFLVGQLQSLRNRGVLIYFALMLSSFALLLLGIPLARISQDIVLIVASILIGFGFGIFEILWDTILQERVPNNMLGRVGSIDLVGSYLLLPLGYLLVGVLSDYIGPNWVFIASGILDIALAAAALSLPTIRKLN